MEVINESEESRVQSKNSTESIANTTIQANRESKGSGKVDQDDTIVKSPDQDREARISSTPVQPVAGLTGQFFSILFSGSIEHGYFSGSINDVYCKYSIVYGTDWMLAAGMDVGISQISRRRDTDEGQRQFVWNLPIDVSFRSYNPYGWPQLVLSVYYFDTFGQDIILGYGCIHLPVTNQCPSMYKRKIRIYSPESSSYARKFFSWLTGRKPELINSRLFVNGECREALHMNSVGHVEVVLNATFKDMIRHGFRY